MSLGELRVDQYPNMKWLSHFQGNSNDETSGAHNGVDTSITYSNANGKFKNGAGFNGSSSKIVVADHPDIDLDSGDFTIGLWVKPTTISGYDTYISKVFDGNNYYQFDMLAGVPSFDSYATVRKCQVIGSTALTTSVWNFVCVVVDRDSASDSKMYLNGLDITSGTPSVSTDSIANAADVWIGANSFTGGISFLDGALDELFILKGTALSLRQIKQLYGYQKGRFLVQ